MDQVDSRHCIPSYIHQNGCELLLLRQQLLGCTGPCILVLICPHMYHALQLHVAYNWKLTIWGGNRTVTVMLVHSLPLGPHSHCGSPPCSLGQHMFKVIPTHSGPILQGVHTSRMEMGMDWEWIRYALVLLHCVAMQGADGGTARTNSEFVLPLLC